MRDLLDEVEAENCIDTSQVFLAGFAVGGVFASITACGLTERIAALATVSGLYSPEGCEPAKPLPVISIHGTGDRFIPFEGGIGSGAADLGLSPETIEGLTFMAAREGAIRSSEAWAAHNGCGPGPDESPVADGVTRRTWSACDDDSAVRQLTQDRRRDPEQHPTVGAPGRVVGHAPAGASRRVRCQTPSVG